MSEKRKDKKVFISLKDLARPLPICEQCGGPDGSCGCWGYPT